jgi:hypothetical protein
VDPDAVSRGPRSGRLRPRPRCGVGQLAGPGLARSGRGPEALGAQVLVAELGEVDVEFGVVRVGLDAEFVGGVLAEPVDVLGQVRRDVDFVRRAAELPEGTLPVYRAERTVKHHRGLVRKQAGVTYDQAKARQIAEQSIRKEAAAKNRPADLINIALEKVVEAGLELPGFSTFDKLASKIPPSSASRWSRP